MAYESELKRFLKTLKERETVISMVFGALVVIAAAVLLVNSVNRNKPVESVAAQVTPVQSEVKSEEIANTLGEIAAATPSTEASNPSLIQKAGLYVLNLFKAKPTPEVSPIEEDSLNSNANYTLNLVKNEQGQVMPENLPKSHTVAKGDSLWKIAEKYYGSGYNWVDIAKANNYVPEKSNLALGQELQLPNVAVRVPKNGKLAVKPVAEVTQTQEPVVSTGADYTVVKGDSLWTIAVSQYQDGFKWTNIYQANKNLIKDPGIIEIGWQLAIPR